MGLLSKALKTAVKAADVAKDASRTKPKSQMNPLVKARKKLAETDFEKSASQEVKDFLSVVEEKDPNQLGEFYSPVVSTLEEMPIGKQGTKGENISAFIQKRAPSITGSEKGNLPKLDPKKKYTREEAIETLKPIDKSYSIEINQNPAYQNPNQRGNQRQNITDKEESYFEVFVKQKDIDPEIEEVSGGHFQDAGILAHTRSSIRRETPAGGPLTKKIKDRERYLLIEEMQSDVANLVEKNVDELGMSRISEDAREVFAEEGPQGNFANEVVDNLGTPFNKEHENILNDWYTKIRKRTDLGYVIGENYSKIQDVIDLKRIYKDVLNIDVGGRTPEQIHKNASVRLYENDVDPDELIMNFGDSEYDIGEYFDETFNYYLKLSTDVSKKERKFGEITYPKSAVPLNTRTEYVTKLIQANIALAKKQGVTKIVIPDYKEIARLRDHIQTDGNKEDIFKMTYEDAVNKALKSLIKESKGQIKVGKRELKYNSAEARGNRKSTATEIDISDFDFNPDTQAFRFNKGGIVPMNNQTQQAFALGGLKDEGGEIDEASGNRVPIGGTKEGVRDDISANVSEGEFIFPADVVRYHGLDKMMALRQEAKMGLKQMERMGQMGNSDEATIPDDLPFGMADLIVVGGEGEPMEFADGGFVPQMQTLQTAPVPTMGGGTSTGTQTPIVYDDFMKTPVVTMQEYRDANGNSIIITSVNGKATTEIPAGYTLYTPPANTAPTTTQAAIQTVNRRSYRPSGDDEGPEPQPDQPAPDYRNMNDDEFFSYMAEQNGFGAKAGNAAGLAIATMVGGPVGLLVGALMRNNKNNQMANMKSRIDRMDDGPAKTNALALYKEYGGETDPKKKEGLFANITNFVTGLVTPVANALGINQEDAAKVAQNAAVTEVSGTEPATAAAAAPTTSLKPILRPDVSVTAPVTQIGPQGTAIGTFTNQDPRQPTAFPGMGARVAAGNVQPASPEFTLNNAPLITASGATSPQAALSPIRSASETGPSSINPMIGTQDYDTRQEALRPKVRPERTGPDFDAPEFNKNLIGYDETGINVQPPQPTEAEQNLAKFQRDQEFKKRFTPTKPNLIREDKPDYTSLKATQQSYGPSQRAGYESDMYAAMQDMPPVNYVVAPGETGQANRVLQKQPQTSVESSYDEVGVQMQDPRETEGMGSPLSPVVGPTTVSAEETYGPASDRFVPSYPSPDAFQYTAQNLNAQAQREAAALQASPDMFGPIQTQQAFGDTSYIGGTPFIAEQDKRYSIFGDELEPGFKDASLDVAAQQQTAAQTRAREAQAQQARIQTRNKEIATATSKIPAYIANSKETQDAIKAGYVGSTTGGYAIGKISGSDGNDAGVVQNADGKVTKLKDLEGYGGLKGTQRGNMTVFSDAEGTKFVKSTFGKKTKLNGDKYEGPGITRKDKGLGNTFFQSAANVLTPGDGKSYVDGELVNDSGSSRSSSTKTYNSLAEAAKDGQHGQSVNIAGKGVQKVSFGDASYDAKMKAESDKADDGGSDDSKIVCTEMYRQTQLVDWQHTMKIWHVYQEKYLTPYHQIGYHWLFKPYVKGMKKSSILTKLGATLAKHRTEHLRYVLTKGKSKDNLVGNVWCKFVHPLVYVAGIFKQKIGK